MRTGTAERQAKTRASTTPRLAAGPYAAIDNDLPNVRAALEWTIDENAAAAAEFIATVAPYWRTRGTARPRGGPGCRARCRPSARSAKDRAALLCLAAGFASLQDELGEAQRLADEALAIFRALGDAHGAAKAVFRLAEAVHRQGHLDRDRRTLSRGARGIQAVARRRRRDAVHRKPRHAGASARRPAAGLGSARRCAAACGRISAKSASPAR